ncbi:DUF1659 domain-containing protein [Bacillus daqingensis]|uniref:DUF1659 domain-containing protein n=1 Tax=Bacillus daqingensis TaxID=872396 RepID=A0ABV9NVI2_9BACI
MVITSRSRLVLTLNQGYDEDGMVMLVTRSFQNVRTDAADESLKAAGEALASLQQHGLSNVQRFNTYEL